MAEIIPILDERRLQELIKKSAAEVATYEACFELNDEWIVIFSFPWISRKANGLPGDGETDFVVFHRTRGVLVVEVKGGVKISCDAKTDTWTSTSKAGTIHDVKNPFKQAVDSKYALIRYLKEIEEWTYLGLQPKFGHGVLLPGITSAEKLVGSDRPIEIIGTKPNLQDLSAWFHSLFDYWHGEDPNPTVQLGKKGFDCLVRHFGKPIEVRALLSTILEDEEKERIRLTEEQRRVVSILKKQKRAAISGGAGTGKTLLAMHRARELAEDGVKTLLLCFNQPLADQLNIETQDVANLNAMSFHQLCSWFVGMAKDRTGDDILKNVRSSNPDKDDYHYCFPLALADALEFVDVEFDAILIDEGQDFRDEYWLPISVMIEDQPEKYLLIFYDHNQQLYSKSSLFPIDGEPFELTRNCRNADPIHKLAYQFYSGVPTEPSLILGSDVEFISAPSRSVEAKRLHNHLTDLLSKEGVAPNDICVLVPSRNSESYFSLLESLPLPGSVNWSVKSRGGENEVCIETVMRFKGLEADYIFFWGADEFDLSLIHI